MGKINLKKCFFGYFISFHLIIFFNCVSFQSLAVTETNVSHLLHPKLSDPKVVDKLLPKVYIVPIDDIYNIKCPNYKELPKWGIHDKDVTLHRWLKNHYHKTIDSAAEAQFFFVPAYTMICYPHYQMEADKAAWKTLTQSVERAYHKNNETERIYLREHTFVMVSHPTSKPPPTERQPGALGIRYLRVDNYRSFNGRDSFTPYLSNVSEFLDPLIKRRSKLLFLPCNLAPASMDNAREFRPQAYKHMMNASNSLVFDSKMPRTVFDKSMKHSDFCLILPGDTPGTAKVYKSIMSGCIPVYFVSFKEQLPFHKFLDWSKFAVIVLKETVHSPEKMLSLTRYLQNLRKDTYRLMEMKRNLVSVVPLFDYDRYEWPSVYHLMLLELKLTSGCGDCGLKHMPLNEWRYVKAKKKINTIVKETSNLWRYLC